jgi:hypothetical protein
MIQYSDEEARNRTDEYIRQYALKAENISKGKAAPAKK